MLKLRTYELFRENPPQKGRATAVAIKLRETQIARHPPKKVVFAIRTHSPPLWQLRGVAVAGGWWLVAGGWLVAGEGYGWWLVAGGWLVKGMAG